MDEKERIRILEVALARLLQWIAAAESRIAVTLGIDTALLGTMTAFAPSPNNWSILAAAFGAVAATLVAASVCCIGLATFPRTAGPKQSYIFFQGISDRDESQYLNEIREMTAKEYFEDLGRQCHRNAQIARDKFVWVKRAQGFLFSAIPPWIGTILCLYLTRS